MVGRSPRVVKGNDIGAFRDHRDARVLGAGDAASDRLIEIGDHFDPGQRTLLVRQARRIERDSTDAHRFELHLGLPFVDVRQGLGGKGRQELVGPQFNQAALGGPKFL